MVKESISQDAKSIPTWETLEEFVRMRAQEFIQGVLEDEVTELLGRRNHERRRVVDAPAGYRNGHGKPRMLTLGVGTIAVRRPRVRGLEERFCSRVLPLFKRKSKLVENTLPELYLHGLAEGDFDLAMRGLLGDDAPLSASSISRLKVKWQQELAAWQERDLSELPIVYAWVDGLYVKAGLEKDKAALLVVIGADVEGRKHVLAIESGARESSAAWADVLRSLRVRGLASPKLFAGDGHLGIWAALRDVYPDADQQRCWNHKIMNVTDHFPKRVRHRAIALVRQIPQAETLAAANRLRKRFGEEFGAEFPKAVATLERDWDRMVTFYRYPREHWQHLRTTNVVESPFAAVRLRTDAARRYKKVVNATAMIWKLLMVAEKSFRRLRGHALLPKVAEGAQFRDGIEVPKVSRGCAA